MSYKEILEVSEDHSATSGCGALRKVGRYKVGPVNRIAVKVLKVPVQQVTAVTAGALRALKVAHYLCVGKIGHFTAVSVLGVNGAFQRNNFRPGNSAAVGAHNHATDTGGIQNTGRLPVAAGTGDSRAVDKFSLCGKQHFQQHSFHVRGSLLKQVLSNCTGHKVTVRGKGNFGEIRLRYAGAVSFCTPGGSNAATGNNGHGAHKVAQDGSAQRGDYQALFKLLYVAVRHSFRQVSAVCGGSGILPSGSAQVSGGDNGASDRQAQALVFLSAQLRGLRLQAGKALFAGKLAEEFYDTEGAARLLLHLVKLFVGGKLFCRFDLLRLFKLFSKGFDLLKAIFHGLGVLLRIQGFYLCDLSGKIFTDFKNFTHIVFGFIIATLPPQSLK